MNIAKIPAKVIAWYFAAYEQYIIDNGRNDDSNSISVASLINIIDCHLSNEERREYHLPEKRILNKHRS